MESDKHGDLVKELNKIDPMRNEEKPKEINNLNSHKVYNPTTTVQCDDSEKKQICTNDLKKHASVLSIFLFVLIFLLSSALFIMITFTNKFNKEIVEHLVLKNGSKSLEWFIDSPIKPLLKVHIFNYTNIDDVLSGKEEKIKIEDIGPFVYEETTQRTKLSFDGENKITFYENKSLEFMSDLTPSHLSESSKVYVPNFPLILAIKAMENNPSKELLFKGLLQTTKPKEFQSRTAKEFLFGYSDSFISGISFGIENYRQEKIGIMGTRRGISTDNLTVYTGEDNLEKLLEVHAMNGESKMNIWDTDECNEIKGTDGTQFSLSDLADDKPLEIWAKSICRTFSLEYEKEVTVLNGIPAKRYHPIPNIFGSSSTTESNRCYCDADLNEKCPPDGVFDATKCIGVSLLMSYPHFYEGDDVLLEPFEGLKPNKEEHQTFVDIHPRMAFVIGGASRMQVNVRIKPYKYGLFFGTTLFKNLPEDLILPICWFEVTAGEIPAELLALVYNTTHTVNAAYLAIQYGSIICMFVSFILAASSMYIYFKRIIGESNENMKCQEIFSMLGTHPTNS